VRKEKRAMARRSYVYSEILEGGSSENTYVVNLARRSTANGVSNADTVDPNIIYYLIQGQQIHQV
jgi:hypothetical protein